MCANGKKGPFFVQTKEEAIANLDTFTPDENAYVSFLPRQINHRTKKDERPGERGALQYFDYMINSVQFFKSGDIILTDGERSFHTEKVQTFLASHGIIVFPIEPSLLHQFINPCDNNFHSVFKLSYYRQISKENHKSISISDKFQLAKRCFEKVSDESVYNMFLKCGILKADRDTKEILSNLLFEGFGYSGKHKPLHTLQLQAYLQWCEDNDLSFLSSTLTVEMMEHAGLV